MLSHLWWSELFFRTHTCSLYYINSPNIATFAVSNIFSRWFLVGISASSCNVLSTFRELVWSDWKPENGMVLKTKLTVYEVSFGECVIVHESAILYSQFWLYSQNIYTSIGERGDWWPLAQSLKNEVQVYFFLIYRYICFLQYILEQFEEINSLLSEAVWMANEQHTTMGFEPRTLE